MKQFKYVIFGTPVGEVPILFPTFVNHDSIVFMEQKPVSAGYAEVDGDGEGIKVWTGDGSKSLGLRSRPEDAAIVKQLLRHENAF